MQLVRLTAARLWSKIISGRDDRQRGVWATRNRVAARRGKVAKSGALWHGCTREDFILMIVGGITLDPTTKMPIVVLKDPDNKLNLPIWIGPLEAASMATELEGIKPQRPMTHDLLRNVLGDLGATVESVEVTELRENTYFARILVKHARRQGDSKSTRGRATRSRSRCAPSRRSTSPRKCSKCRASCMNPRRRAADVGSEPRRRLARQMVRDPRADVARRLQVQNVRAQPR